MQFRLSSVARTLELEPSGLITAAKVAGFSGFHSATEVDESVLRQILTKHGMEKERVEKLFADNQFRVDVTLTELGYDIFPFEQVVLERVRFHFNPDQTVANPDLNDESLRYAELVHSVAADTLYNDMSDGTRGLSASDALEPILHRDPKERAKHYQSLADEADREAQLCDRGKQVSFAAEHRLKSLRWRRMARDLLFVVAEQEEVETLRRSLPNLSDAQRSRVQQKLMILDQLWFPVVPEMDAMDPVVLRAKALKSVRAIASRIGKEQEWAVDEFVRLLNGAIEIFNEESKKHPSLFLKVMEQHTLWPVSASSHPRFMNEWNEISGRLGKQTSVQLDQSARWNPQDKGTQVAMQLLQFTAKLRFNAKQHLEHQSDYGDTVEPSSSPMVNRLASLPEPLKDNVDIWWKAARLILERSYPKLESEPIFSDLVHGKSHRKYPSRIRARILEKVRSKFLSILPLKATQ